MVLKSKEGYSYTNGDVYGKIITLGKEDVADNWTEIPDSEIPQTEEESEIDG